MSIFLIISQYNVVCRVIGVTDNGKFLNRIEYGNGWPGVFGNWANGANPLQRLAAIRLRFTMAKAEAA